jgi:2-oxoisovalerate dehydrogenase E1 component
MKGMLTTALKTNDPVIVFENERLYDIGECFHESGVPTEDYDLPFGVADVKREGSDITLLTVGAALYQSLEAATILEDKYGISVEVIDARSLVPFDYETVLASLRKTGKLVIVGDSNERGSIMRDIASNVTEFAFDELDAPPIVVGARNLVIPAYEMTKQHFPTAGTILDAIHQKILPLNGYTPTASFTTSEKIRRAKEGV